MSTDSTVRKTVLPGGLRVVTEFLPAVRSVALGIWVGVGSRDEDETQILTRFCADVSRDRPQLSGIASWLGGGLSSDRDLATRISAFLEEDPGNMRA